MFGGSASVMQIDKCLPIAASLSLSLSLLAARLNRNAAEARGRRIRGTYFSITRRFARRLTERADSSRQSDSAAPEERCMRELRAR